MPTRPTIETDYPPLCIQITDDGSRTLLDSSSKVAFHSASGALSETRHVYFRNSGVQQRISDGVETSVLEVGLGTAMGLLLTLGAARDRETKLHYTALERTWLPAKLIRQLNPWAWTEHRDLVDRYLDWRNQIPDNPTDGCYRWQVDPHCKVIIHIGTALRWAPNDQNRYDAIYFDPFDPSVDADLWSPKMLQRMHDALALDGRLVSYCVKRSVRDTLRACGFEAQSVPGPKNGKREVLVATKRSDS